MTKTMLSDWLCSRYDKI